MMKNEEWRMKKEEWRMKNEERRMKNEDWRLKIEKLIKYFNQPIPFEVILHFDIPW